MKAPHSLDDVYTKTSGETTAICACGVPSLGDTPAAAITAHEQHAAAPGAATFTPEWLGIWPDQFADQPTTGPTSRPEDARC